MLYIKQGSRYAPAAPDHIMEAANTYLDSVFCKGEALTSPDITRQYVRVKLADRQHEVFACLFLDNRHRVIEFCELFRGTIDGCSVTPREVVKTALSLNAAAAIFVHNHPSGITDPSNADKVITQKLQSALALVDVRVLDHLIVGDGPCYSFAESGLL